MVLNAGWVIGRHVCKGLTLYSNGVEVLRGHRGVGEGYHADGRLPYPAVPSIIVGVLEDRVDILKE